MGSLGYYIGKNFVICTGHLGKSRKEKRKGTKYAYTEYQNNVGNKIRNSPKGVGKNREHRGKVK
jgi:hypothetical protein